MKTKLLVFIFLAFSNLYVNAQIPNDRGYDKIEIVKFNGTNFYKVEKRGLIGICDMTGKEIVSPNRGYTKISYSYIQNKYEVEKRGKVGICDLSFNEIISPDRGYEKIVDLTSYGKHYYKVVKAGKYGACDLSGKEIVVPMYNNIVYLDTGFHCQDAKGTWYPIANAPTSPSAYASTASSSGTSSSNSSSSSSSTSTSSRNYSSTSSSSSSSSSSSTSRYGKLLKSGTFTFTGVMYGAAGYSSSGMPFLTSFKIYENYLVNAQGNAYPFIGMQTFDGKSSRGYKCNDDCFFYYGSDGVLRQQDFMTVMGVRIGTISIIMPGDVRAAYTSVSSPSGGGFNSGGSSSSGSQRQRKKDCRVCYNTGICQTCNGRGWIDNPYVDRVHPCTTCNNEKGNAPNRGKCQSCLYK